MKGTPVEERRRIWELALGALVAARGETGTLPGPRSPWVFHHRTAARRAVPGQRYTKALSGAIMAAAKRAGIPTGQVDGFVPHDLRHRRASLWILEGVPLAVVAERMGHARITTTQGYTHVAEDHRARLLGETDGSAHLLLAAAG
jgi:integrase/recombinase XerC